MRRLARRLFTLCPAASLLLCVAVCMLWVRSATAFDHLKWRYNVDVKPQQRDERSLHAISVRGRLFIAKSHDEYQPFPPWQGWRRPHPPEGVTRITSRHRPGWANFEHDVYESFYRGPWRPGGLGIGQLWTIANHGGPHRRFVAVVLPHGLVALLLASPAACVSVRRWRRRRSHRAGLCPSCGYDPRASPERCPECGAARE